MSRRGLVLLLMFAGACTSTTSVAEQGKEPKNMPLDAEPLVVRLDFTGVIERRLPDLKVAERTVTSEGLLYRFTDVKGGASLVAVVALYATEALAVEAVERQIRMTSVVPTRRETSTHADLVLWESPADPQSGSLLLRRMNAVVRFLGDLTWSVCLDLMQQIDRVLQTPGPEVTHAATARPPRITGVRLPAQVSRGQRIEAQIDVADIAPSEALLGTANNNVLVTEGPRPTFAYYAPPEPTRDEIVLIVSTPGNLLSTTTILIDVK